MPLDSEESIRSCNSLMSIDRKVTGSSLQSSAWRHFQWTSFFFQLKLSTSHPSTSWVLLNVMLRTSCSEEERRGQLLVKHHQFLLVLFSLLSNGTEHFNGTIFHPGHWRFWTFTIRETRGERQLIAPRRSKMESCPHSKDSSSLKSSWSLSTFFFIPPSFISNHRVQQRTEDDTVLCGSYLTAGWQQILLEKFPGSYQVCRVFSPVWYPKLLENWCSLPNPSLTWKCCPRLLRRRKKGSLFIFLAARSRKWAASHIKKLQLGLIKRSSIRPERHLLFWHCPSTMAPQMKFNLTCGKCKLITCLIWEIRLS